MADKNDRLAKEAIAKTGFRRFAARRPRLVLLIVNLVGISLVVVIAEIVLRSWGLVPGYLDMGHDDFRPLPKGKKLEVSTEFYADSGGIYKALPDSFWHRAGYYVNSWGFRNPEFDLQDHRRKRIMLIGDSFTWGATARPIDSSFADLLRGTDVQIFNFGIPGTEPDQYERIAETYIPLVEPDEVCLFFYMNNDPMTCPHTVLPSGNCYHITNVGWLNAYLEGSYIGGPEETYQYYLQRFNIPPNNWLNRFCAQTVIGSRLWQVLDRMNWVNHVRIEPIQSRMETSFEARRLGPYSGTHLRAIDRLCKDRGIPFHMFIVPTHNEIEIPDTAARKGLFKGLPFIFPSKLTTEDYYGRPDGHFNNSGHRKLANVILEALNIGR